MKKVLGYIGVGLREVFWIAIAGGVIFGGITGFNYLGEKIEERNIAATRGVNDIEIYAKDYTNGMYLYSINNGMQRVSKRMIVAN